MKRFLLEKSGRDVLTSHSGLALVGLCLNRHTDLPKRADELLPCQGIRTSDVVCSYIGLLSLAQNDFEAISGKSKDCYFREALGVQKVPSPETLRQRLDALPQPFRWAVADAATELVRRAKAPVTGLATGHVPLDCDVFPMDNSGTRKEGVCYTYQGFDGYTSEAAYLGREGWCLELELRPGSQHAPNGFLPFLRRVLHRARRLVGTATPLLVRLDSAHDAGDTRAVLCEDAAADWIIKWNPRNEDHEKRWQRAEAEDRFVEDPKRPGLRTAILEETLTSEHEGRSFLFRRIVRLNERTCDRKGQQLLVPEREIEGWWTNLDAPAKDVIVLYNDHATSEQYHSEFKSDLAIERLPSGKFATNALVLAMAGLAYNILRLIGQLGLLGEFAPVRHPAKRRRLRTVIQELMYLAARLIRSGHRLKIRFAEHCPGFAAFREVYLRLAAA